MLGRARETDGALIAAAARETDGLSPRSRSVAPILTCVRPWGATCAYARHAATAGLQQRDNTQTAGQAQAGDQIAHRHRETSRGKSDPASTGRSPRPRGTIVVFGIGVVVGSVRSILYAIYACGRTRGGSGLRPKEWEKSGRRSSPMPSQPPCNANPHQPSDLRERSREQVSILPGPYSGRRGRGFKSRHPDSEVPGQGPDPREWIRPLMRRVTNCVTMRPSSGRVP